MTNDNTFANLIQYLSRHGVTSWSKADPAAISTPIPEVARRLFPSCAPVFARYGDVIYSAAWIPKGDIDRASLVVRTYFDLYARERGWQVRASAQAESEALLGALQEHLFAEVTAADVNALLRERRFVVLQGPPGTGKTRMAEEVRKHFFASRGRTVTTARDTRTVGAVGAPVRR